MATVLQRFLDMYKAEQPTPQCVQRIQRDLAELHSDPASCVFAAPEENDITVMHAVIVGSWDSPLEGGLFHLVLKCPPDYPIRPPHAFFLTGAQSGVSFNSHIYGGRICLDTLGLAWSPAQTVGSLLVSILSLLSDGAEERMRHNTLSIAICDTLEGCLKVPPPSDAMPPPLKKQALKYFVDNYAKYEDSVKAQIGSSSGIFSWITGKSDYESLLQRLRDIKKKVDEKKEADGQQNNE
ncbi:hypothetical protein HPB51_010273 [Rhipicephalus microplus]|uniref:UBC core domain-containing protein n=1 Tax=Rhipicephalus microplus TaxID=6941 RepID=A0A9J6D4R7_RHIMP|nr:ubiquitin-conjugating enzyme E2 Z-like [Rhipicephalus microplus]KAH8009083.1 hypothetical protein HPB51_010273 [Rhipicephalus microplus]